MAERAPRPSPDAVEMFEARASGLAKRLSFEWRQQPWHVRARGPRPDPGNGAEEGLGIPEGIGRTFEFAERDLGRLPDVDAVGYGGYWLVSKRFRQALLEIDAEAFEMAPVSTVFKTAKGDRDGPAYWLCDVVRFVDAMDESPEFSHLLSPEPMKRIWPNSPSKERFHKARIGATLIFRAYYAPILIYCTSRFKDEIEARRLKGMYFRIGGWAA